jgi:hypothetical protein
MEVRDGFILDIFNYCDRWCETCTFTSRCRLFADVAEHTASLDPHLRALVSAPLLPEETSPAPPRWLQEEIDSMNDAATVPGEEVARVMEERDRATENEPVAQRSIEYSHRVYHCRGRRGRPETLQPTDPRAVMEWFHTLIPAKIHRALVGRATDDPSTRNWPADHDGSAKVALEGIDRSIAAWQELVGLGAVPIPEAHDFVVDLIWQRDELERLFPSARAFVRPAFDEPDEVAKLLAAEGRPWKWTQRSSAACPCAASCLWRS